MNIFRTSKFTRTGLLPAAAVVFCMVAAPQAALASAKATGIFELTDVLFFKVDSGANTTLELGTDISIVSFNETATNVVERFFGPGADDASISQSDTDASDGVALDPSVACVGPGCGGVGQNDFTEGNVNTGEYNRADQVVSGSGLDLSAVNGQPRGTTIDTNTTRQVAEAITQSTTQDTGTARLVNSTVFDFIANMSDQVGLSANIDRFLNATMGVDTFGLVTAGINFTIEIFDLGTKDVPAAPTLLALTTAPSTVNASVLAFQPNTSDTFNPATPLAFSTQTVDPLVAGNRHRFRLEWFTTTDLNVAVPEPGVLSLLSLGLVGVGLGFRRRATRKVAVAA